MDKVGAYIEKKPEWTLELNKLREIIVSCELEETIKWGAPVYMKKGKNILGFSAFKNYVGIWFFQGGTLKDDHKVLMNAQEGKTQAMRQWRFYKFDEIDADVISIYIKEAIGNQKSGKIIKPKRNANPIEINSLLQKVIDSNSEFSKQFDSFSVSKRREYADYISSAKRETTQLSRLEKIIPLVINGAGLHDKYKKC